MIKMTPYSLFIIALLLSSCGSQPSYNLDIPLSEVSKVATSSTSADNVIIAQPNYVSGNMISTFSNISLLFDQRYNTSPVTLDSRVTLYRTQSIDLSTRGYTLQPGLKLGFAARERDAQFRVNLGYTPGVFTSPNNEGLRDLTLFTVSGDISLIKQYNNVVFEAGARFGAGIATFAFATPLVINGQSAEGDGINNMFFATPIGIQVELNRITVEYQVSPTLSLHSSESELGFDNDLVFAKWAIPMALGLGFNF